MAAGQLGTAPRDQGEPASRHPGRFREQPGHGREQRLQGEHPEAQQRRRRHRQLGQQVAGDADQADVPGEHHRHRRAQRLRGRRRRKGARQVVRPAPRPQGLGPVRPEDEQPGRGEHRQQEAERVRQERVEQDQHQDRPGERGHGLAGAAGGQGQHADQSRPGRPEHAGLGAADGDEGQRQPGAEQGSGAQSEPQQRGQPAPFRGAGLPGRAQQRTEDDRQVGPADRDQVDEVGGPEGVFEVVGQARGVTDDQAREQPSCVRREPVGGRAQPLAQAAGDPLRQAGRCQLPGRAVDEQQRRGLGVVPLPRRPHLGLHRQPFGREQPLPGFALRASDHDGHGCVRPGGPPFGEQDDTVGDRVHRQERLSTGDAAPGGVDLRVPRDGELGLHRRGGFGRRPRLGVLGGVGEFRQRAPVQVGGVQWGRDGRCRSGEQDGGQCHGGSAPAQDARTAEQRDGREHGDARHREDGDLVPGLQGQEHRCDHPGRDGGQQQPEVGARGTGGRVRRGGGGPGADGRRGRHGGQRWYLPSEAEGRVEEASEGEQRSEFRVRTGTDATDLPELVDGAEGAVRAAVGEDALGEGRADAGEGVELFEGGAVEADG